MGDAPVDVAENRARTARELPRTTSRVAAARQVHGARVVEVGTGDLAGWAPPEADALVSAAPGAALAVVVADCVPVLLVDGEGPGGPVGVAHAGRRGLDAGVVPAAVAALRDLGARSPRAVLGPSVCGRCYAVPEAMARDVGGRHPAALSTTRAGGPALDVAAGVLAQLAALEVPADRVAGCTAEDPDLYSVRRDGPATGRSAGLVWLAGEPGAGARW